MERYIRGNKVGVLVSCGTGVGFSTWARNMELATDKDLIEAYLEDDMVEFQHILNTRYDNPYVSTECLNLEWVESGKQILIKEYLGREEIVLITDYNSFIA